MHSFCLKVTKLLSAVWPMCPLIICPHLKTSMNVTTRTFAVRSASTCLAATSVIVRRAIWWTLWARHARLSQVMFERTIFAPWKKLPGLLSGKVNLNVSIFSLVSSRHNTHAFLHKQTRGEEVDGWPQRIRPRDPTAEERGVSRHGHA